MDKAVDVTRREATFLATPTLSNKTFVTSGSSAIDRTSTEITKDTTGVVDIIDFLGMPINSVMLSFVKDDGTVTDSANIEVFAGRYDSTSFSRVFKGSVTIGPATCGHLPDGTALTTGLWAETITSGGNDYWGANIIGNGCDDIAQLQFDLRGCRYLYLVVSDADVKAIVTGY